MLKNGLNVSLGSGSKIIPKIDNLMSPRVYSIDQSISGQPSEASSVAFAGYVEVGHGR